MINLMRNIFWPKASKSAPAKAESRRYPVELTKDDVAMVEHVRGNKLSMCSEENLFATILACRHVVDRGIPGDFVECGVWRGGQAILAAYVFAKANERRRVVLYDTFKGMTEPTPADRLIADGSAAQAKYDRQRRDTHTDWCYASLDEVKDNFRKAGLLGPAVEFVAGPVEETLPPGRSAVTDGLGALSVLRLDTDWYESTATELKALWPKLSAGGICIVDDYGWWSGSKKAVDEYFAGNRPFFSHIDITARLAVKP